MEDKMKQGAGLSFVVEGLGEYKLALVENKMWSSVPFFVFTNGKYYVRSLYIGGETGFGIDERNLRPLDEVNILTMDLNEIRRIEKEEARKREEDARKKEKELKEQVARLNSLPKEWTVSTPIGNFTFSRTEAEIKGSRVEVYLRLFYENKRVWLGDFLAKDNKLLKAKFYNWFVAGIGKKVSRLESDMSLELLVDKKNSLHKLFADMKGERNDYIRN